jgi:hypothetical protein
MTIVPIFKNKGESSVVTNILSKIFERVIHDTCSISKHVFDNDLICEFQSGFIAGDDTQKQLAHMET